MGSTTSSLTANMVKLGLTAVFPVVLIWTVLRLGSICRGVLRALRFLRIVPKPKPAAPPLVPLEKLVADLCRLSTALRDVPPEASRARKHGLLLAYDDVLDRAARALEVPGGLAELRLGMDRDLERMRVEAALRASGLQFGPVRKRQDTP
jgi:hypothetical protein